MISACFLNVQVAASAAHKAARLSIAVPGVMVTKITGIAEHEVTFALA